ncbi:MAG: hypothetical protein HYR56_20450 [Acidobacteria bacterium]|nr:hypothetical protein [Acidobacteriota bacterium]MBI3423276.1 hypothetical protein [Acidobacteriota bacterium]
MPQATQEQEEKIIALYKNGATFGTAMQRIPADREHFRGFYHAIATVGQLDVAQARSVFLLNECDPEHKGKVCPWAIQQIAEDMKQSSGVDFTSDDVINALKKHFGIS